MKDINAKKLSNSDLDRLAGSYVDIIEQSGIIELRGYDDFLNLSAARKSFHDEMNDTTITEVVSQRFKLTAALKNIYSKIIAMEIETNSPQWSNLSQKIFENNETFSYEF
ncbi:MAG: hypothetical protein WCJ03_04220 [Bacteroidales bacterium]|jgi:hypothetical protein